MIIHNFFGQPEADESTRGYLHGGILIDFIGQKAPVPLTRLFFLDLLVMLLNFVMLGLIVERVKVAESRDTTAAATTATATEDSSTQAQDHDHEERGLLNRETETGAQPANDDNETREQASQPPSEEELERTRLLADPEENGGHTNHQHALDEYSSGEAVIVRMGLFDVIRDQWRYRPSPIRRPNSFAPSDQTATFLRERFGLQVGANGRLERITT